MLFGAFRESPRERSGNHLTYGEPRTLVLLLPSDLAPSRSICKAPGSCKTADLTINPTQ